MKELLIIPEHLSSRPTFSMVRVAPQVFCVVSCGSLFIILTYYFGLSIALSVLRRFTASECSFWYLQRPCVTYIHWELL
jgi:hypothetical protein